MIEKGDKVRVCGTKYTGEIIEVYGERDVARMGTNSKILFAKVRHDRDERTVEYVINELRKISE